MHHRSFSFDKFKDKVIGRRSSESSILELATTKSMEGRNSISNPMIIISESLGSNRNNHDQHSNSRRLRAQSLSLISSRSTMSSRSRSRSVTKKQTKELIKQETAQIISKKLLNILQDLGLQNPIPLNTANGNTNGPFSKTAKIYVSSTNDCIYLAPASSASFTYEDVENGGIPHANDSNEILHNLNNQENESAILLDEDDISTSCEALSSSNQDIPTPNPNLKLIPKNLRKKMESFSSPNYLCTKIDSETPIPHTFAVIIELKKETAVKDIKFEFQSLTHIAWPSGDPYNRTHVSEKFKIGYLEWQTSLKDCDFYINISNSNDIKSKNITPDDLAKRTRNYKLISVRDLADGTDKLNISSNSSRKSSIQIDRDNINISSTDAGNEIYKAGLYVFLLPILLPEHIPPTINSINGSLDHILDINFNKISDTLNRKVKVCASYSLPMVRTPPSFANSIADKPIYVNRVWNDALHYIITFPKKYVSLGSEHVINVKLVPLVKDVIIKRIKFNVLERITYVSKNLSREYDYDSEDPYHIRTLSTDNRIRERVVSICELKTKNKTNNSNQPEPYKEEVIKCPDNNLLFSCYEPDLDRFRLDDDPLNKSKNHTMIASPLDINIALPFLTTKVDKSIMSSSIDEDSNVSSNPTSRKASVSRNRNSSANDPINPQNWNPSSPIIGALETNITHNHHDIINSNLIEENDFITPDSSALMTKGSHNHLRENIQQGYTTVTKALYPDSNFRHIQIHHRLQVCFRISKPDPKDDFKMHHYEVVVDTPLILLSAKCNDESIQLPKYDEISGTTMNNLNSNPISFRTPNFNKNGITIKTLGNEEEEEEEKLPSFEEAISVLPSPLTRSSSLGEDPLSRIPSISIPNEPAPAYDFSQISNNALINPLNIDEIVNLNSDLSKNDKRQSRLRSSLVSSFAPSNSPAANIKNGDSNVLPRNSADNLSVVATLSSNGIGTSTSSTDESTDDSVSYVNYSCSNLIPKSSSTGETTVDDAADESIINGNTTVLIDKLSPIDHQQPSGSPSKDPLQDNDQISLFTQETTNNFGQKIPLLENSSFDNLSIDNMSNIYAPTTNINNSKDNLSIINSSNQHQVQNIYHTY